MIWKKKTIKDLLPPPVKVSHGEYSMILSAKDERGRPSEELIQMSLKAIQSAISIDLQFLQDEHANLWPGEHYRLLAAFCQILNPALVIEIGTSTGLSALSMLPFFSGDLVTYDIKNWHSYPNTVLHTSDFGRLKQVVGDLGDLEFFQTQKDLIQKAEFIFIDASHDGALEKRILAHLEKVPFKKPPILFFDDIRVWTMLKMWREITHPKLDLTSFGHWSGTGIVELTKNH